jgi:Putative Ig domain
MIRTVRSPLILLSLLSAFALAACSGSVSITTTSLPNGVVGQAYSVQLQGSNVASWSVMSGTLPDGITLSTSGLLSGTPTTAGTYSFTVEAAQDTSLTSPTVSQALTLTVTAS